MPVRGYRIQAGKAFSMETKNIMIVGVGGQGTLLASKLLGRLLLSKGYDVKVSEVHGMSQRGGSVVTYVRWGDRVCSPIIDKGQADCVLSFELLEAARYPENLVEKLGTLDIHVDAFDALSLAEEAGNSKAVNLVLMGRLARHFDFTKEEWMDAIEHSVPPKFLELNKKAFALGQST